LTALVSLSVLSFPVQTAGQWRSDGAGSQGVPGDAVDPRSAVRPMLLSLVLPGAGQHVLGQRRRWAYLALEVVGWVAYLDRHGAGGDLRDRYRDFAWEQGRIQSLPRIDGNFDYYERLSKWPRSGAFDADPSRPGIQPELDPAAYNGSIWALAVQIFIPPDQSPPESDPRYQDALAYYERRAYGPALLWDWDGKGAAQADLGRLIEESDDRFRQATTALGLVIANHLVSAVDAYLSGRGGSGRLRLQVVPDAGRSAWMAVASVRTGP